MRAVLHTWEGVRINDKDKINLCYANGMVHFAFTSEELIEQIEKRLRP